MKYLVVEIYSYFMNQITDDLILAIILPWKCLFGTVKLTRNAIKNNFFYNGQEMAFDRVSERNFANDFAWNVTIFHVDNSC